MNAVTLNRDAGGDLCVIFLESVVQFDLVQADSCGACPWEAGPGEVVCVLDCPARCSCS